MLVRVAPYKPALQSWPTRLMLARASLPRQERLGTVGRALLRASSSASDELIGGLPLDVFILERRLICADIWRVWARHRRTLRFRGVTCGEIGTLIDHFDKYDGSVHNIISTRRSPSLSPKVEEIGEIEAGDLDAINFVNDFEPLGSVREITKRPSGIVGVIGYRTHWELCCSSHTPISTEPGPSEPADDRGGHREALVTRRYLLTERDDYKKYSSICRMVQKLVNLLKQMDPRDPYRIEMTDMLLEKLYNMGVISTKKSLAKCDKLSVSSFCRRRLASVLVNLKFCEHLKEAVMYIEQGHVRVGPETVTDPAFLVTRNMEDFVTWVDSSKIKRKVLQYNEQLDDYDAMM
uniref:U3 small nucleolar ribonucleoprotein protein IMP3 n=1 Tax=Ananas comosus var. bracteatus TaxID=296719 RepID=A0A6V7P900_ANACO|nr:unnamed protein product [Ananas comosus var. bracteatus]